MTVQGFRGSIFHFISAPKNHEDRSCYEYYDDGLLLVEAGKITKIGLAKNLLKELPKDLHIQDYSNHIIMPGFIDTHIHYAQTEIIASYGKQLLDWLEKYVFPIEGKYGDRDHAASTARFFLEELLRNGTTSAAVYSTVHEVAADVLFAEANKLNLRIITGKTMMDRNAPEYLLDNSKDAYDESKKLIEKWHGKNRLAYAITPRFAPTSTEAQLEVASSLYKEYPSCYLQTHLAENKNEIKWVLELFPWAKDYTDIYDHYDFLKEKSIFGHAVFISDREFTRLAETRAVCSWCPTSNFFLGSGLFNIKKAKDFGVRIGIGTDVGGGSSFSMLQTLCEAYKVAAIQGSTLSPLEGFYYMTLGNAKALSWAEKIGNFEVGKEADFVILDLNSTPLLKDKMARANSLEEKLFNLMILGDDRAIEATYILGDLKYSKLRR